MFRVAWPIVFSLLLVARAGLLSAAPFTYVLNGSSDDLSVVRGGSPRLDRDCRIVSG